MDCLISYLPLSHIAGQIADIIIPSLVGCSVWFAQPDALKGSLKETLAVRPYNHYFWYTYICLVYFFTINNRLFTFQ